MEGREEGREGYWGKGEEGKRSRTKGIVRRERKGGGEGRGVEGMECGKEIGGERREWVGEKREDMGEGRGRKQWRGKSKGAKIRGGRDGEVSGEMR